MKIATYNVWNEKSNMALRKEQLIQEIIKTDADIIALQEVLPDFWEEAIKRTDYSHHAYQILPERGDGLAFLSKYPIESSFFLYDSAEFHSVAFNITFKEKGFDFSVINVHLPWDSILVKEKQIIAIHEYTNRQKDDVDYFIILGDFNCSMSSSVHNFLLGNQSLLGCEEYGYDDLASIHAALNNYNVRPTLDFTTNPRWKDDKLKYPGWVVDRILFKDNADYGDYFIGNVSIFGTDISPETGLAPSDHYGVLGEMDFTE